ncbi:hypothetical protein E2C01_082092 [Portunus trituberculatus]|uniref:Uncharacterized protein n=1 Tax=Portunus trituberculatus TaxID=210409 RepID=A0A5B7IXJ0_PORTR|nr:hypothetical protein [Portunus trituberculatus]
MDQFVELPPKSWQAGAHWNTEGQSILQTTTDNPRCNLSTQTHTLLPSLPYPSLECPSPSLPHSCHITSPHPGATIVQVTTTSPFLHRPFATSDDVTRHHGAETNDCRIGAGPTTLRNGRCKCDRVRPLPARPRMTPP